MDRKASGVLSAASISFQQQHEQLHGCFGSAAAGSKRGREEEASAEQSKHPRTDPISLGDFERKFEELSRDASGARMLIELARTNLVPLSNFLDYKERLRRSFSNVKWKHIFELYGIKHVEKIPVFRPSVLYISRETCKDIFQGIQANEMATCALSQATSETKVVTWMNSMLTPILQMFNGVINNDAEGKLGESSSSTGGFIEFIYMVLEACVVVVIECKYNTYTQDDVAQMMVELEAAWHNNVMQQLGTPILTGALCSRDIWQYWRYDGTNFQQSTNFLIRHHDPLADAKELVKMFGIFYDMFFDGYIRSLKGFISKSEKTGGPGARRPSYEKWKTSLSLAEQAYKAAQEATSSAEFDNVTSIMRRRELPEEHSRNLVDWVGMVDEIYDEL